MMKIAVVLYMTGIGVLACTLLAAVSVLGLMLANVTPPGPPPLPLWLGLVATAWLLIPAGLLYLFAKR